VPLLPSNSKYLTTFMLLNYMIGAGILNQPYVVMKSGIVGAFGGFALATYMTWKTVNFLTDAGLKVDIFDYSELALHAFGVTGEKTIDFSIALSGFGALISYLIVIGGTLSSLLHSWGCTSEICGPNIVIILAVCIFVAPLCLFRHFGHLAILSVFSIGAIWTVIFLVLFAGPSLQVPTQGNLTVFDPEGTMTSLGSMIFALSICTGNFQAFVSTEKKSQNSKDWNTVTASAIGFGSSMCLGMGTAGYLYFRQDTDGVIITNFTAPSYDFFKVMIVMHLICYLPAAFVVMRYSIVKLTLNQISEKLPLAVHTVVSLGLVALITFVVIMLQSSGLSSGSAFSLVLDLTGGVAGSLTSFILPAAIYLKEFPADGANNWRRVEAHSIFYMGILLMALILFMSIHSIV
jgi:amino acid permease